MPRRRTVVPLVLALLVALGVPAAAGAADPEENPPAPPGAFVSLTDVDPSIRLEIRYTTNHNFIGRPIRGYEEPRCLLTREAAAAVSRVQRAVRAKGYTLKVYDCFRPQRAVDDFVAWAKRLGDVRTRKEFYPRVPKSQLFDRGYIAAQSGHSRGSTIDLTLVPRRGARTQQRYRRAQQVDCASPLGVRFRDDSIDMGTGFDCFDTLSHPFNARVRGKVRENRLTLRRAMVAQGFGGLKEEWWHFTLKDEPYPKTFFDFPVAQASLR